MPLNHKQRSGIAFAAFFACLATALAGADFPPPAAFLWLVPLAAIGAITIYLRMPTYAQWAIAGLRRSLLRALAEGCGFGIAMGLLAMLIPGTGDPTARHAVGPSLIIWLAVIGAVGAAGSGVVYVLTAACVRGTRV